MALLLDLQVAGLFNFYYPGPFFMQNKLFLFICCSPTIMLVCSPVGSDGLNDIGEYMPLETRLSTVL